MLEPDDIEPVSRTYVSQGLTLHYLDWGNEGAPLLLLLHGSRDHARSWDWTARALRDRWQVIAVDLRGHGDSAWSPDGAYLSPYHLLDLAVLVDVLGRKPVTLIAHSFGGNVASRYAGLYPDHVHKLVVVDGLGPDPSAYAGWEKAGPVKRTRDWLEQRRDPKLDVSRRFATIDEAVARMAAANPHLSDAQARHLAVHGVRLHPDGYGWKFDPRAGVFAPEDFAIKGNAFWQDVTAPVLLLHGTESWTTNPEVDGRAASFRDQRTISFDKAGHWIHHDQFDGFIGALNDFL